MSELPYPYPQDIRGLITQWSKKTGYRTPEIRPYQRELEKTVGRVFAGLETIPESAMLATAQTALNTCRKNNLACISIDDVYMPQTGSSLPSYLDITRLVDTSLNSTGLGQRNSSSLDLESQMRNIKKKVGNQPVLIYDDVAWEGSTLSLVIDTARSIGITVVKVQVAIGIGDAIKVVQSKNIPCTTTYYYAEVEDTVNERDYMIGSPNSGRTIVMPQGTMGAPYIKPLGKTKWGSIPEEKTDDFSLTCLQIGLDFWQKSELLSGCSIPTRSLAKPPLVLGDQPSVVEALQSLIANFK